MIIAALQCVSIIFSGTVFMGVEGQCLLDFAGQRMHSGLVF